MNVNVHVTGLEAVRAQMARLGAPLARQALDAAAVQVEHYIEVEAGQHNQTGALVRSLYKRQTGDGWEIGHDLRHAPHAVFVHFGTKPHIIRPKNKKTLRWATGNQAAFAKGSANGAKYLGKANAKRFGFRFATEIHHPGYKGDAWMARAAALAPKLFEAQIHERIKNL